MNQLEGATEVLPVGDLSVEDAFQPDSSPKMDQVKI